VHDRDIELSLESILYLEAARSRYIFEIYPTESVSDIFDSLYEFIYILRTYDDREGIDSCELLKKDTLPFHDRHTRLMSEIS
jgi:hypothetical protein